jgi:hypothetical protein
MGWVATSEGVAVNSRLSLAPIARGHWKGLSKDVPGGGTAPDVLTRLALTVPSGGVLVWAILDRWTLAAPIPLLTGVTLLSGGILGVFAQLSTLRLKLTEKVEERRLDVERDGIDEAVAHLLMALTLCITCAVTIMIGLNITDSAEANSQQRLHLPWSAIVLSLCTYLTTLFLVIIPKLYSAYVEMNQVRSELNGFHRSPSRWRSRIRR